MTDMNPSKLGELIRVRHGFAFKGEYFVEDPTEYVLVTPGNFSIGGGFQDSKLKYYKGPIPEEYVLHPGDLVVTMTDLSKDGDTLGYPAFIPNSPDRTYLHNQRIGLIDILDEQKLDKQFLYYRLLAADYRHHILATASGSTVRHTSPDRIRDFATVLPSLAEQCAIASVLAVLDDKIEQNRRTAQTLERLAQAIFRAWFIDFEPVEAKSEGASDYPSMTKDVFGMISAGLAESELGPIPDGWSVMPITRIANFLNGLALQKYPPRGDGADLPVIKIPQLRRGSISGAEWANGDVPEPYIVDDRALLFSWSGTLEVKLWFGGRGALNQHLFKVTSAHYPQWFVLLWLCHHLPWFRAIASDRATTMGHIKREHLTKAKIVVPPKWILAAADKIIGPLYDLVASLSVEIRSLEGVKDALFPKLLSGEVTVMDDRSDGDE